MKDRFSIKCSSCAGKVSFETDDVDGLDAYIDHLATCARAEGYDEGLLDGEVEVPSEILTYDTRRPLWELAAAIRRGDRAEAEHQLDQIASELGDVAMEQVQQGRFSLRTVLA